MKTKRANIKVCIVACAIEGLEYRNGAGVTVKALALELAANKIDVDILYCEPIVGTDEVLFPILQLELLEKGIRLFSIDLPVAQHKAFNNLILKVSNEVFHFLRAYNYDFVHFMDPKGLAYASAMARKKGLDLHNTTLCMHLLAPQGWLYQYQSPEHQKYSRRFVKFENRAFENVDVIFGISQYSDQLIDTLNIQTKAKRIIIRPPNLPYSTKPRARSFKAVKEVVYFGALITRKGIIQFCEAIQSIQRSHLPKNLKFTFLGSAERINKFPSKDFVNQKLVKWRGSIQFISDADRDTAHKSLLKNGVLAVIPSQSETYGYTLRECLDLGIPFICSDIPAFQEQIPKSLKSRVVYGNTAYQLATKLNTLLTLKKAIVYRPCMRKTQNQWAQWHRTNRNTNGSHIHIQAAKHSLPKSVHNIQFSKQSLITTKQNISVQKVQISERSHKLVLKSVGHHKWYIFNTGRMRHLKVRFKAKNAEYLYIDLAIQKKSKLKLYGYVNGKTDKLHLLESRSLPKGRSLQNINMIALKKNNIDSLIIEIRGKDIQVGFRKIWLGKLLHQSD